VAGKNNKRKNGISSRSSWVATVFMMAVLLSAFLSFMSEKLLKGTGLISAILILSAFILLGIIFDILGLAVASADERPFHSMAAHRTPGAKEALALIHNAEQVSSVCNDVVGDICGIVSGTTAAIIVIRLRQVTGAEDIWLTVGVTALISGLTIGGKAAGKTLAIRRSTSVVHLAGRFLHLFHH